MYWVSKILHFIKHSTLVLLVMGIAACGASALVPTPNPISSPIHITLSTPIPLFTLPTPPTKVGQPTEELAQRWIQGQPCVPPCWEGITPGKTLVMEAVEILNRLPFITQIDFGSIPSEEGGSLVWKWMGSERGGGSLNFPQHVESPRVAMMTIMFPDKTYRLSDIIAVYGEPSHVVPSFVDTDTPHFGRTIWYDLRLIYLTDGFYLETEQDLSAPPHISSIMELAGRVTFFPSNTTGLDSALRNCQCTSWNSTDLIPWQGFQDFATYCKQARPPAEPMFGEMCGRVP
jgi:hypothetical protein